MVKPLSRTFIPANLKDNPFLSRTQYKQQLDNLPAELRRAIRDGDFQAMREDDEAQLIPRVWVDEAMARWQPVPPPPGAPGRRELVVDGVAQTRDADLRELALQFHASPLTWLMRLSANVPIMEGLNSAGLSSLRQPGAPTK